MEITIRVIVEKDYLALLPLWKNELGNRLVNAENIVHHYDRIKNDERYKTFVASADDKIVGFVSSVQSYGVGLEIGFMHITALAVQKENQNKGIGTKLLKHMEDYAKAKGIHSIILKCSVNSTDAHAFYQRNGYAKDAWCFDKCL